MDADLTAVDLENVEFEDVLQLHRGWRRAETALNEVTDELSALKRNYQNLQDSHRRFKNQIQSLESVKDFTISLQAQLNLARQENVHLAKENAHVTEANSRLEKLLKENEESESRSLRDLREAQAELEIVRAHYHEVAVSHKELENMLSNEVAKRTSMESCLVSSDAIVSSLRVENSSLRLKLESNLMRMSQCDQELSSAAIQLSALSGELDSANEANEATLISAAEISVLKGDVSRLLRLMEHYPASREFLDRWYDSDGMSFVGMSGLKGNLNLGAEDGVEFDDFIEEGSDYHNDITPGEYEQFKRSYSTDRFPISNNFEDEAELWVPRKAANTGLQFLLKKIPHVSSRLITELLRKLNKVWLKRDHRKFGDMRAFYDGRLSDLRRQLSHLKPYKGVIAEYNIRRLKNQVREERDKSFPGKSKKKYRAVPPGNYANNNDYDNYTDDNVDYSGSKVRMRRSYSASRLSEENFMEASDYSLETMEAHRMRERDGSRLRDRQSYSSTSTSPYRDRHGKGQGQVDESNNYPSEQYLRGALWLGRNLNMVIEELAEALDFFRSKFLSEVTSASINSDLKCARSRLSHLANTSINEAVALTNRSRARGREILQGVAHISVGDVQSFQELLGTLPIESELLTPHTPHSERRRSRSKSSDPNLERHNFLSVRSRSNSRSKDRWDHLSSSRSQY